jgi:hypothetical protein
VNLAFRRGKYPLLLLIPVICALNPLPLDSYDDGVHLLREYKKDNAALVEVSTDGHFILARGTRKVAECPAKRTCLATVLAVYETTAAKPFAELITQEDGNFFDAGFVRGHDVNFIEQEWNSSPLHFEWNPVSGSRIEIPWTVPKDFAPTCVVDDQQLLAVGRDKAGKIMSSKIAIADAKGLWDLQQPTVPYLDDFARGLSNFQCTAWRSGSRYLVTGASPESSLYWISIHPDVPAQLCHTFTGERIHGYTISPDGSMVGVSTEAVENTAEIGKLHPQHPLFLSVLDGKSCKALKRFELQFPEHEIVHTPLLAPKNKYYDNRHFPAEFAARMAISPDNSKLAVAYGVFKGYDGTAFFGLYSLPDGVRLATLRGDVYRGGFFHGFLNDEIFAPSAPITGAMQFSPDSKTLYATSNHLRQWDVSALR